MHAHLEIEEESSLLLFSSHCNHGRLYMVSLNSMISKLADGVLLAAFVLASELAYRAPLNAQQCIQNVSCYG